MKNCEVFFTKNDIPMETNQEIVNDLKGLVNIVND